MGQVSSHLTNIFSTKNAEKDTDRENKVLEKGGIKRNSSYFLESDTNLSLATPRNPLKRIKLQESSPDTNLPKDFEHIFSSNMAKELDDYLDFTFLKDYPSISYIKNSKVNMQWLIFKTTML